MKDELLAFLGLLLFLISMGLMALGFMWLLEKEFLKALTMGIFSLIIGLASYNNIKLD